MSTDIKIVSAPDLSIKNPVMNFRGVALPTDVILAGASLLTIGVPPFEALRMVLQIFMGAVRRRVSGFSIWLLVGHSAWQPDTRIVRYHKLWGSLKARGTDIPFVGARQEVLLESDEGLKYFGAVQCSEFSTEGLAHVLLKEHCSYLILAPDNLDVMQIIKQGWSGELSKDIPLLTSVSQAGGLVLRKVGEFDDKEWGVVAIGRQPILSALLD